MSEKCRRKRRPGLTVGLYQPASIWLLTIFSLVAVCRHCPPPIHQLLLPELGRGYCQVNGGRCTQAGHSAYFTDTYLLPSSSLPHVAHQSFRVVIFRLPVSFRDVQEMLAMRGVTVSYETVREWCPKFGQIYANGLRHKSPRRGDQWHLDEVFLKINGRPLPLACSRSGWRRAGYSSASRRDKKAAKNSFESC